MSKVYAVILAGGRGERFWPLSTSRRPKQLLNLVGGRPMLAAAVGYLDRLVPIERVFVVTSRDLAEGVARAVPELPAANVLGEPIGRDTAAACALGSVLVRAESPDGVFAVLTADHIIGDVDVFQDTVRRCIAIASTEDVLVTIGIKPTYPSTGFGYIEAGASVYEAKAAGFRRALRFVEKPNRGMAEAYLARGNFYWNSGMFVWSVPALRRALERYRPEMAAMARRLDARVGTPDFLQQIEREYAGIDKISIDYAVMEKADNIVMAQGHFRWDDVGTWAALERHLTQDGKGNAVRGACEVIDAERNVVVSEGRLTALIGVHDLVVVQGDGVTLVCPKERAQDVRRMVQLLRQEGRYDSML